LRACAQPPPAKAHPSTSASRMCCSTASSS
jgi:hypothetical protein